MSLDPEPGGLLSKSIPEKVIPTGPVKATLLPLGGLVTVPLGAVDGGAIGDDRDGVVVDEEECETVGFADDAAILPDPASLFATGEDTMQNIPITITTSPSGPVTLTLPGTWNIGNLSESDV